MSTPTRGTSNTLLSLPLPSPTPKAPSGYPDLYRKRRETAKIQMLEREISFLEEELKSSEGLQPASRCCKEIADFVMANSDPLLPTRTTSHVACGSGCVTSLALTCLGSAIGAVMGALNIKTCQVAVPTANHATAVLVVFHLPIALAALMEDHIAAKIAVVAKIVALSQVAILGGLFPLAASANALALALAQNVPRFVHVVVVQIAVGTLVHTVPLHVK
ncbi:Guanine nucleotide-binding protein subunit gamma 3 [Glycine max]|nr:Guanine nucleotide-binding protein subunit gamma 3 [Glycine max]